MEPDQLDLDISIRAGRYFAGVCVSCGVNEPNHALNPNLPDGLTHCTVCANLEIQARHRGRNDKHKQVFYVMVTR